MNAQALSMLEPGLPVIITSRHSARLQDAALTLASTLGLDALAALPKPLNAQALRDAASSCEPASVRAAAPNRPHCDAGQPRPDAGEVLNGLHQHQFELHYQPKASLHDGTLRGAESLIRWRHPQHGLRSTTMAPATPPCCNCRAFRSPK